MKYVYRAVMELEFKPTDDPNVMSAEVNYFTAYIYRCALCGGWDEERFEARTEHSICDACAGHLANLWNYARSGRYLTWPNSTPVRPSRQRAPISAALRSAVLLRDGYRCRYCGGYEGGLVLDHVFPWSRQGADTAENLVAACRPCNQRKTDLTPDEAGMVLRPLPGGPE